VIPYIVNDTTAEWHTVDDHGGTRACADSGGSISRRFHALFKFCNPCKCTI
jgi:hypothetical protein